MSRERGKVLSHELWNVPAPSGFTVAIKWQVKPMMHHVRGEDTSFWWDCISFEVDLKMRSGLAQPNCGPFRHGHATWHSRPSAPDNPEPQSPAGSSGFDSRQG
jgi:hypothetical protein